MHTLSLTCVNTLMRKIDRCALAWSFWSQRLQSPRPLLWTEAATSQTM